MVMRIRENKCRANKFDRGSPRIFYGATSGFPARMPELNDDGKTQDACNARYYLMGNMLRVYVQRAREV